MNSFESQFRLRRYRKCGIRPCKFKHYANGFCREHNRRFKLYGNPNFTKRAPLKVRNHKEEK